MTKSKPFKWNTRVPHADVGVVNRPEPTLTPEVLTKQVQGQPASDIEERLYAALVNREMLRQRGIYLRELRHTVSIDDRLDGTRTAATSPAH